MSSLAELIARSMELAEQSRQFVEKSRSLLAASRRTLDRGEDDVVGHVLGPVPAAAAATQAPLPLDEADRLRDESLPAPDEDQAVPALE